MRSSKLSGFIRLYAQLSLLGTLALAAFACNSKTESPSAGKDSNPPLADSYYNKVKDDVIAQVNGRDVTREMLILFNQNAKAVEISNIDIIKGAKETLKPLVEEFAATEMAARHADDLPEANTTDVLQMVQASKDRFLMQILLEREGNMKAKTPAEKQIQEFYKNNSKIFRIPFNCSMRHIFIPNYQSVETREGDTLESLAQKISGDVRMTSMILVDNNEKSLRAPDYGSGTSIIPPVQAGELLLVPVGPDAKKKNLEKIEKAAQRLKAGEDFAKVAAETTGDPSAGQELNGIGLSGRILLPEVLKAAQETPVNGISPVFDTKHGYNIIQIIAKQDETTKPLEEVRSEIVETLQKTSEKEAMIKYVDKLYSDLPLKINYALFKDPATPDDAIVVSIADKDFKNKDMQVSYLGKPSKNMSDEAVIKTLKTNSLLQANLMLIKAKELGIDKSNSYLALYNALVNKFKRTMLTKQLHIEESRKNISEQEAKDYFNQHKNYFTYPPTYTYYLLLLNVPQATANLTAEQAGRNTLMKAAELTQGVKDLTTFKQLVAKYSDDAESKKKDGLLTNIPESVMGKDLVKEIKNLNPNQMSVPMQMGNSVGVIWLVEKTGTRPATIDDYKDQLQNIVKNIKMNNLDAELKAKWVKEANIVMR